MTTEEVEGTVHALLMQLPWETFELLREAAAQGKLNGWTAQTMPTTHAGSVFFDLLTGYPDVVIAQLVRWPGRPAHLCRAARVTRKSP